MPRTQRVSDGKVPGYGKQVYDALAVDAAWRHRIAQEGTGYRTTDESGSSTSISMIWCPTAKLQDKGRTAKRPSEIKDLIGYDHRTPRPTPAAAAPAAAPAIAAPVPPPSASQRSLCSSRASNHSGTSINTAQLDSEASRLQAAAHARQVGQTYLRVGNLVEARKHLARAEQLLQIETPNVYDVPTTAALDEAKAMTHDSFA